MKHEIDLRAYVFFAAHPEVMYQLRNRCYLWDRNHTPTKDGWSDYIDKLKEKYPELKPSDETSRFVYWLRDLMENVWEPVDRYPWP